MSCQGRRNFYVLLADALLYSASLSLWDVNSVIPLFLDHLGTPSWLIGTASSVKQMGFLIPQLLLAVRLPYLHSLAGFIRGVMFFNRPQLIVFLVCLLTVSRPRYLITVFFICFTVFCLGEGTIQIPWVDLLGRTVRPALRGRVWGISQIAGGLAAIGTGLLISNIVMNKAVPYPYNFFLIFALGTVILLPSLVLFSIADDPPLTLIAPSRQWMPCIHRCFRHRAFIKMVMVELLLSASSLSLPYYLVIVRHRFPQLAPLTGRYIFLVIIGGVIGGFLWGFLSEKKGKRFVIMIVSLCTAVPAGIFMSVLLFQSRWVLTGLLGPGFIMAGMAEGGWLGFVNYILDITTNEERPFFVAINNTLLITKALMPILGGLLRTSSGDLFLLSLTTVVTASGFILSAWLKDPPLKT